MLAPIYPQSPEYGDAVTANGVIVAVLTPSYRGGWIASTSTHRPRPTHTPVETREIGRERLTRWMDANGARLRRETYREPVKLVPSRLDKPFRLE